MLLVLAMLTVNAQDRYNLAVYAIGQQDGKPISTAIKTIAQNTAITNLTGGGNYQLIERANEFLQAIDQEYKKQMSGDVADDKIAEMGVSYGAEKVCAVSITIEGDYLYVAARIVDVAKKISFESGDAEMDGYTGVSQIRPTVAKAIGVILGNTSGSSPTTTSRPSFSGGGSAGTDRTFTVPNSNVSFKMVFVKGGSMYLGCTSGSGSCYGDESPSHNVTLTDYYMGETEVTQALWKAVMGYNNNPSNWKGDQLPVEMVSWTDCQEFVSRLNSLLSSQLPQGYRFALPSEAQWEYAARGGQKSSGGMYAGSSNVDFVGWYDDNSGKCTHPVKQKAPNDLGLYDMSGNVWEWCEDWYSSTFYSDNRNWTDPVNTYAGSYRVFRGGSWKYDASICRVAYRYNDFSPGSRENDGGFRLSLVRR